jgi:two-component system, NarL family, nitrate/nitrite response regulator NarL
VSIPIRLLIVDDHEIVRIGVRLLLSDRDNWEVCGEAGDGIEAVEKVAELSPDIVILDLTMPVLSGLEVAKQIREIAPSTRIVFFSVHEMPIAAQLVGADAFVTKSLAAEQLEKTIDAVLQKSPQWAGLTAARANGPSVCQ